jgi:hypothetical protein
MPIRPMRCIGFLRIHQQKLKVDIQPVGVYPQFIDIFLPRFAYCAHGTAC